MNTRKGGVFKDCVAQACDKLGVDFAFFLQYGRLRDFSTDYADTKPAEDLAIRALTELSSGEFQSSDDAVQYAVILFLDEILGAPANDAGLQRLRDLRRAVREEIVTEASLRRWRVSWYGR